MHYDEGTIQAYIDGEMNAGDAQRLREHIMVCDDCRRLYNEIMENQGFADNMFKRFEYIPIKEVSRIEKRGGFMNMWNRYKKGAIAACLIAAVGISMTLPPVKAAAQEFLQVFRVNRVETVEVTQQDLEEIQNALAEVDGKLDLKEFGSITASNISGEYKETTIDEAQKLLGFDIKEATYLPFETKSVQSSVMGPGEMRFNLNVDNVNRFVKTLGGDSLLPDELEGKEFIVKFGGQMAISYTDSTDNRSSDARYITLSETSLPEIVAPDEVNVDNVRKAVLELPFMPQHLKQQLSGIDDWKETLPVAVSDEDNFRKVDINGNTGYFYKTNDNNYTELFWAEDGILFTLSGQFGDEKEAIRVAESVR